MELINTNQAIARGAIHAGVDLVAHYPGSPVNLIEPELKKQQQANTLPIRFNDSVNEHTAALVAMGASFSGARSLLIMKHVGLNIAADPLNFAGYPGVEGGMVIVVGTDPGANSSTGEEDVHWYAPQFNFPLFEPGSIREAYEFTIQAFELSEQYKVPVLLFVPVALCHSFELVDAPMNYPEKTREPYFKKDPATYINVGNRAVANHRRLLEKIQAIGDKNKAYSRHFNAAASVGVVTRGLGFNLALESIHRLGLQEQVDVLNAHMVYPVNKQIIRDFVQGKKELLFIEDQDGFLEQQIKMDCFNDLSCTIEGKSLFPKWGRLGIDEVTDVLAAKFERNRKPATPVFEGEVPERIGTFCEGCPHTASFFAIDQAIKELDVIIGGDIGCSSLPPFRADWLLCMNAGVGISQGMSQVLKNQLVVSTGGDGSFFHGGMLSVLNAVHNKTDLIHIVLDNGYVAMTGHQDSPVSNPKVDPVKILEGLGVDKVIEVDAFDPHHFIARLKEELYQGGVRVFWVRGACVLKDKAEVSKKRETFKLEIDTKTCTNCNLCFGELDCPAIERHSEIHPTINTTNCARCGQCASICPSEAIQKIPLI